MRPFAPGQENLMTNTTWKCLRCDATTAKTTRENEPFNDILPGVVLLNVEVTRCEACGNREVEVPYMDNLMKAVARAVVKTGGRLTGDEVRFLRSFLELSGVELAELMDSTASTVSRWENNRTPVGRTADLLLRTIAGGEVDPIDPDRQSMLDVVRSFVGKLDEQRGKTVYPFRLAGMQWELAELPAAARKAVHMPMASATKRKHARSARSASSSQRHAATSGVRAAGSRRAR
jgi:putative zinc finger/helix-turn-helix YgiT family protein